jgi:hypothetical protein
MQTMQQSNAFASGMQHQSQEIPMTRNNPNPFQSERVSQERDSASRQQVFANFSKNEKDEWLLGSSQEIVQM